MTFRADLHTHTTVSDGSLSPAELVRLAKERELSGLAITDHDTFEGHEEAIVLAEELGVELLVGAEFSTMHARGSVHLLAYAFDPKNGPLLELCAHHVERRRKRNREILKRLQEHGMSLSEEEVLAVADLPGKRIYGRPHIAQAMVARGFVRDLREAFSRWIGDGKLAYVSAMEVSVEETIERIHGAGGLAVIAHPHLVRDQQLLYALLELPFDGIEGFYGNFPGYVDERYVKMGEERGWIITGGSDFHGAPKPHIQLGASWVGEETFRKLKDHACRAT